jgi:hypothetical protein
MIIEDRYVWHIVAALREAIEAREKYERQELGYFNDSAQLAAWRKFKAELEVYQAGDSQSLELVN